MLRVATVLSAREWESRLVATARETALVRLVLRAFVPDEVGSNSTAIDVVVAGAETPWVTPTRVAAWRRLGLRVVGLHPPSDRPAAERLRAGGADLVLADDLDAEVLIREIRMLDLDASRPEDPAGQVTVVTGVHGAPGTTEVSVALAWNEAGRGEAVLVDGDLAAPAVAVRLGMPPRPDLADVVDRTLGTTTPDLSDLPAIGRLTVVPGTLRSGDSGLRPDAVVDACSLLASERAVVVDAGRWPASRPLVREADSAILVVGTSPIAIVRLARLVEEWVGPHPSLVVNGVESARRLDVVAAVRRWSGLEPAAVIPRSRRLRAAAVAGADPPALIRRRLVGVGGRVDG